MPIIKIEAFALMLVVVVVVYSSMLFIRLSTLSCLVASSAETIIINWSMLRQISHQWFNMTENFTSKAGFIKFAPTVRRVCIASVLGNFILEHLCVMCQFFSFKLVAKKLCKTIDRNYFLKAFWASVTKALVRLSLGVDNDDINNGFLAYYGEMLSYSNSKLRLILIWFYT